MENEQLNWDNALTQKQKYFLLLKPILGLQRGMIKAPEYEYLNDIYDPLAIGLKIINLVIDNTTFLNLTNVSGITRQRIIEIICPFLLKIDNMIGKNIPEDHHRYIINRIIDVLISTQKESHLMEYIDYSSAHISNWLNESFRLLYHDITPDNEVQIMVSTQLINIFTNILDMKIEDQQMALLYMLDKQIQRGDFESAIKTAENNCKVTLIFAQMIREIIFKTKRRYQTLDWIREYPKNLSEAKDHITQVIQKQRMQQDQILHQSAESFPNKSDVIFYLNELKDKLQRSFEMLLPLQNLLDDARKTFEIQSSKLFETIIPKAFELEDDFLKFVLYLQINQTDAFLNTIQAYFTSVVIPPIINLSTSVNLLMESGLLEIKNQNQKKIIKKPSRIRSIREKIEIYQIKKYSESLRKKVLDQFMKILNEENVKNGLILSKLLKNVRDLGFSYEEQDYLRIFIQGRFADKEFEGRYFKENLRITLIDTVFRDDFYYGRDMAIYKIKVN